MIVREGKVKGCGQSLIHKLRREFSNLVVEHFMETRGFVGVFGEGEFVIKTEKCGFEGGVM